VKSDSLDVTVREDHVPEIVLDGGVGGRDDNAKFHAVFVHIREAAGAPIVLCHGFRILTVPLGGITAFGVASIDIRDVDGFVGKRALVLCPVVWSGDA